MPDPVQDRSIKSIMFERFADRLSAVEVVQTHESGCEVRTTYRLDGNTVSDVADEVEARINACLLGAMHD